MHEYRQQGNQGTASIHRQLRLRVQRADSPPAFHEGRLRFRVKLAPQQKWRCYINMIPVIEGEEMAPASGRQPACPAFHRQDDELSRRRAGFLRDATHFSAPGNDTMIHTVLGALEQARRDLVALRLYDLDRDEAGWMMAAGLPLYVALFGRDTLTASWQAGLLGPEMMVGSLNELARWQGTRIDDWRDEEPGVYIARLHAAEVLWWLDEKDEAKRLYHQVYSIDNSCPLDIQ